MTEEHNPWAGDNLPDFDPITELQTDLTAGMELNASQQDIVDNFFKALRTLEAAVRQERTSTDTHLVAPQRHIASIATQIEAFNPDLAERLIQAQQKYIEETRKAPHLKKTEEIMAQLHWAHLERSITQKGLEAFIEEHPDLVIPFDEKGLLPEPIRQEIHRRMTPFHLVVLDFYEKMTAGLDTRKTAAADFPTYPEFLWTSDLEAAEAAKQELLNILQENT
jgi:hypothetical protein